MKTIFAALLAASAALLHGPAAHAQSITIGLGADVTSIDPHFHNLTPNNNVGAAPLRATSCAGRESQAIQPGLADRGRRSTS